MKKIIPISLVFAFLFSACSKNYYSHRSVDVSKNDLLTTPVVTDVNVDLTRKITSKSDEKKTVYQAMDEAYYRAITSNNIDVLVDPIYNITDRPTILFFRRRATAEVTGFAGKYNSVRNINEAVKSYGMDTNQVNNFVKLNTLNPKSKSPSYFDKPANPKKSSLILLGVLAAATWILLKVL
jgi:hypothetical protein